MTVIMNMRHNAHYRAAECGVITDRMMTAMLLHDTN